MANRNTFNGSSTEVPWSNAGMPEGFGDQYARHIGALYDVSVLPLTDVGGTGNVVTATMDPPLDGDGLKDGMKVTLTWANSNSGPVTLAINGAAAVPVLKPDGSAMDLSDAIAGTRALLEYIGSAWRMIGGGSGGGGATIFPYYKAIVLSETWIKPEGYHPDTAVLIECWGGGASGTKYSGGVGGSGGSGGGYRSRIVRYGDIPSSAAVVVGAGGAARSTDGANAGGNTTFDSIVEAQGGGGGSTNVSGTPGNTADSFYSGGKGKLASAPATANAIFGGGGGGNQAGTSSTSGGTSVYGGNGGTGANATGDGGPGQAPGGGGGGARQGTAGPGGRGEVRVWIMP